MRTFVVKIGIATILAAGLYSHAAAQDTPPTTGSTPQDFILNLPAGVSLISAPLNTGQKLAENQFLGLPSQYSLFYGWKPDSQQWAPGDQVPAALGGGYWVYLATPATLVVQGQPYGAFTQFTGHIEPGWHLFGVPFQEGIGWKDFHFFASGNPISLDTAIAMGWIDANVTTMQGSEVQIQTSGDPLQPGTAYWVHTNVPFNLRAERQAGSATSTASSPSAPQTGPVNSQASSTLVGSTGSDVMGWLSAVAGFLSELGQGAADFAEGNWAAGSFDTLGGAFGLIEHGLDSGTDPTAQLNSMDGKLDDLLVDVNQISGQLSGLNTKISGLTSYIESQNALGTTLLNDAETWLNNYYLDQTQDSPPQSRNWARWYLAGCTVIANFSGCPEADNPITTANYNKFVANYIKNPGQLNQLTDDFPLWWANSVLGYNTNGVQTYQVNGTNADGFITLIYKGIMANRGTDQNALVAFMQWVLNNSGTPCANDVSDPKCDLYSQVYTPLENFFSQAIGDQTQLEEAIVEADGVLAQRSPGSYGTSAETFLSGVNSKINDEVEVFLEAAERLALYRAADGTQDWNTFPASDAGQLLARADFMASQLSRQPDSSNPATTGLTPPWPSSGVVGRVFYADGETPLSGTRAMCQSTSQTFSPNQPFCTSPMQLSEASSPTPPNGTVMGDWPYITWKISNNQAVGTPTQKWTVQRLVPVPIANLPTGDNNGAYAIQSTSPDRLLANLSVNVYDASYNNLPAPATGSITFGSFSGLEGSIGKYGLGLALQASGANLWTTTGPATSHSGGGLTSPSPFQAAFNNNDPTVAPGGGYFSVAYALLPVTRNQGYATSFQESWSASADINLTSLPAGYSRVHLHWPTTVNVNLNSEVTDTWQGNSTIIGGSQYYSSIQFTQQLLNNKGAVVDNTASDPVSENNSQSSCYTAPFVSCTNIGAQLLDAPSVALTAGAQYALKVSFSSTVLPYSQSAWTNNLTYRSATGNSAAAWVINAPMITLTPAPTTAATTTTNQ